MHCCAIKQITRLFDLITLGHFARVRAVAAPLFALQLDTDARTFPRQTVPPRVFTRDSMSAKTIHAKVGVEKLAART